MIRGMKMANFKMTQEQFDALIKASQPVPMIALQCGKPRSQQERANAAWKALGDKLGFDHMTVRPTSDNQLCFKATLKE
jgi:hypothetical protein